jgi:hypothetical protein
VNSLKMLNTIFKSFIVLIALITLILMMLAARPWGGNEAYQNAVDYLILLGFILWTVSPFVGLFFLSRRPLKHAVESIVQIIFVLLICLGGLGLIVNSMYLHPDAQGGLIFLSLPFIQWLLVGVLAAIRMGLSRFFAFPA